MWIVAEEDITCDRCGRTIEEGEEYEEYHAGMFPQCICEQCDKEA